MLNRDAKAQGPTNPRIAVVIPCYRVERHIASVIRGIPNYVSLIVAVDDASPDGVVAEIERLNDPRVVIVRHEKNQGVGGAMVTGYEECLRRDAHIIVKMDGDGQMDPGQLPALIAPLLRDAADYTKGNRWNHPGKLNTMPVLRRLGNSGLSFLTKFVSGYWKIFDPCNGYTAVRSCVLRQVELHNLAKDYFFEISLLAELGTLGAVTHDVLMPAIYGTEVSSLRINRILRTFPHRMVKALVRRVWNHYFIKDFGPTTLLMTAGSLLMLWSLLFGSITWVHSVLTSVPATAGTVMLSAMPFLMGFQMLLQSIVLDMSSEPSTPLCVYENLSRATEEAIFSLERAA